MLATAASFAQDQQFSCRDEWWMVYYIGFDSKLGPASSDDNRGPPFGAACVQRMFDVHGFKKKKNISLESLELDGNDSRWSRRAPALLQK